MDTDGPPPSPEPEPLPVIELDHRSWWRSSLIRFRFAKEPWSGHISLHHLMPDNLRAALNATPGAAPYLARHDRLGGLSAFLMVAGFVATVVLGILGWFYATTSRGYAVAPMALACFSLAMLGAAAAGVGWLLGIDSFRMFLKAVDAYNAHVKGTGKDAGGDS